MTTREEVARHPFLAGLTDDQVTVLQAAACSVHLPAGTRIFDEGGVADRFWLLTDGFVHLDTVVPGRGGVIIESLAAGTVLGWSWLFPPHTWHFGAQAVEDTTAIAFDAAAVRAAMDADPALGHALSRRFIGVVVDRLQATRIRLLDLYGSPWPTT
jgi:CRP/FNR family transcriptional regulator, cyclic AMP receptor protein